MPSLLVSICLLAGALTCSAQIEARKPHVHVSDVWTFPVGTWVENLAFRENGQILVTTLSAPHVFQVDPTMAEPAAIVAKIPHHLATLGITETTKDVFYVIACNFSLKTGSLGPHTSAIYKLDVSKYQLGYPVSVSLVANFGKAGLLNGLTTLDAEKGLILAADSLEGAVWRLNVKTGAKKKVITNALMKKETLLGINGLKVDDGHLLWTNLDHGLLARIPIDASGVATGPATIVASGLTAADDFILGDCGGPTMKRTYGYVAGNEMIRKFKGSHVHTVSQGSLVNGSTACQFPRQGDCQDLYVSTNGNNVQYNTGDITSPGKVVKISFK